MRLGLKGGAAPQSGAVPRGQYLSSLSKTCACRGIPALSHALSSQQSRVQGSSVLSSQRLAAYLAMMTTPSPSSEPLLQSYHDEPTNHKNNRSNLSLCALEDGETSSSDIEELRRERLRAGFWKRLRMSMRRRRNGEERSEEFRGVRLNGEEKTRKLRWRKRTCLAVPVVVLVVL